MTLTDIERKMHQHNIEQDNMDREARRKVKEIDDEVEKAKEQAKAEVKEALTRKQQLQRELES